MQAFTDDVIIIKTGQKEPIIKNNLNKNNK